MAAALRVRGLFPAERCLLVYLVDRANDERVCWPTIDEIMRDIELSRRAINMATAKLEVRGLIEVERRYKQSSLFRITEQLHASGMRPNGADDSPNHRKEDAAQRLRSSAEIALQRIPCGAEIALSTPQKNLSKKDKDTVLRTAEPATPTGVEKESIPDAIASLFTEGLETVRSLTGLPSDRCRTLIGRWRKMAGEDSAVVLGAIRRAGDVYPADPVAFIAGCLRKQDSWAAMEARLLGEPAGTA